MWIDYLSFNRKQITLNEKCKYKILLRTPLNDIRLSSHQTITKNKASSLKLFLNIKNLKILLKIKFLKK